MGGREWIRVRVRVDTDGFMIEGAQSRMGVKAEKIVDWGYFVEPSRFGTQVPAAHAELDETCVLRVLWAGRDIPLKHVRDIARAVEMVNGRGGDSCHAIGRPSAASALRPRLGSRLLCTFTKLTGVTPEAVRKAMREHDVTEEDCFQSLKWCVLDSGENSLRTRADFLVQYGQS